MRPIDFDYYLALAIVGVAIFSIIYWKMGGNIFNMQLPNFMPGLPDSAMVNIP